MNVLDLFSGIGGFALGFERAGCRTVAFCEQAPAARAVLARAWPGIPCYPDIRTLTAAQLLRDGIEPPDILCGGFPCQDISTAGHGRGLAGERSVLWHEMLRLVQECRPGWVVAENVPALRVRGADAVLAGLEAAGYACWPLVVGAGHAGALHRRQRVFVVAHADRARLEMRLGRSTQPPPRLPTERCRGWPAEPRMGRVAHGVSARVDRLRALGNAIVPDVAALIASAIVSVETAAHAEGQTSAQTRIQAAADRTRSPNTLRNFATFGPTTARQYPA